MGDYMRAYMQGSQMNMPILQMLLAEELRSKRGMSPAERAQLDMRRQELESNRSFQREMLQSRQGHDEKMTRLKAQLAETRSSKEWDRRGKYGKMIENLKADNASFMLDKQTMARLQELGIQQDFSREMSAEQFGNLVYTINLQAENALARDDKQAAKALTQMRESFKERIKMGTKNLANQKDFAKFQDTLKEKYVKMGMDHDEAMQNARILARFTLRDKGDSAAMDRLMTQLTEAGYQGDKNRAQQMAMQAKNLAAQKEYQDKVGQWKKDDRIFDAKKTVYLTKQAQDEARRVRKHDSDKTIYNANQRLKEIQKRGEVAQLLQDDAQAHEVEKMLFGERVGKEADWRRARLKNMVQGEQRKWQSNENRLGREEGARRFNASHSLAKDKFDTMSLLEKRKLNQDILRREQEKKESDSRIELAQKRYGLDKKKTEAILQAQDFRQKMERIRTITPLWQGSNQALEASYKRLQELSAKVQGGDKAAYQLLLGEIQNAQNITKQVDYLGQDVMNNAGVKYVPTNPGAIESQVKPGFKSARDQAGKDVPSYPTRMEQTANERGWTFNPLQADGALWRMGDRAMENYVAPALEGGIDYLKQGLMKLDDLFSVAPAQPQQSFLPQVMNQPSMIRSNPGAMAMRPSTPFIQGIHAPKTQGEMMQEMMAQQRAMSPMGGLSAGMAV